MSKLPSGWYTIPFDDSVIKGKYKVSKIQSKDYLQKGYPIIDQGEAFITGYTDLKDNLYDGELPVIVFGDHTRRFKFVDFRFAAGADGTQILQPNKVILVPKFLFYYLRTLKLPDAGYSRHYKFLRETTVVVPPIEQQRKIVLILEKAEKAIQKRKEAEELVDKYLQSVFIEMFGDPATNPMGWLIGNIGQLTKKTQYGTSKKASETVQRFKVLRMNNITSKGNWDFSSLKYIDLNESEQAKYIVYKGEMLFNRTNSRELVGKTAVYRLNEPMAFAGYLVKLIPNNKANSEYIAAFLNSKYGKKLLFSMAKNIVGMANINAEELKSINIMIPPIDIQNKFAEIVQKVETLKQKQKESTEELETLFKSLMQKAFRGELTDSDFDSVDTTEFSIESLKELIQSEFGNMEFDFEELSYAIRNQYKSTEYDDIKIALFDCLEKRKNEYRPFLLQVFDNEKIHYKIN